MKKKDFLHRNFSDTNQHQNLRTTVINERRIQLDSTSCERIMKSSCYNVYAQGNGAIASYANQVRSDKLAVNLKLQEENLAKALEALEQSKAFLRDPSHILGSLKTKHGEIAEHLHVDFSNADRLIVGKNPEYTFENVHRTGPIDYLHNGAMIQSKFCQKDYSMNAILEHLEKYPWFIKEGGSYNIPFDHYNKIKEILSMSPEEVARLSSSDGGKVAKSVIEKVKQLETQYGVNFDDVVTPSQLNYDEVQLNTAETTIENKAAEIAEKNEQQNDMYKDQAKPTFREGAKVAAIAAAVDGVLSFGTSFISVMKYKDVKDFTADDWKNILKDTAIGTARGGITGAGVYALTNLTNMSAPWAAAIISSVLGLITETIRLVKGDISIDDYLYNLSGLVVNGVVSAGGAVLGQMLIPVPVLGAVIGSLVATQILNLIKKYLCGGTYYTLLNKMLRELELSSAYNDLADAIAKSDIAFQYLIDTSVSEENRYNDLKEHDAFWECQLNLI